MRFLISAAVVAAALLVTARASFETAPPPAKAPAHVELSDFSAGRAVGPRLSEPEWFGSKWWKKLGRFFRRLLDFIDGIIDDFRHHPGDDPGDGGSGGGQAVVIRTPTPLLA